jgi:hypothetical protein
MTKINLINTQEILSEFISTEQKNGQKREKDAVELSVILNQMMQVLSDVKDSKDVKEVNVHSSPSLGSSAPNSVGDSGPSSPSAQAIAAALAQLAAELSSVQQQISTCTNAQQKNALLLQEAQIQEAITNFQTTYNILQEIEQLENYFNSLTPQQQQEWQEGTVTTRTFHGWWIFGYYTYNTTDYRQVIGQEIAAYLQANFGINISGMNFDNFSSLSDLFTAIEDQVMGDSLQKLSVILTGQENPAITMVMKLLESGAISAQQAQMMLLGILQQMMQMLALIDKASAGAQPGEGPSSSLVAGMMAEMSNLVSQLQSQMAKFSSNQTSNQSQIAQDFIAQAQASLQKAQDQYNKIEQQEHSHSFWSTFLRVVSIVISVVVIAIACCTGQFEIAALTVAFLVLQQSGALDKMTQAISQGLIAIGLPPTVAKVLADVLVVAIMIVATCGAGAAAGAASGASEAVSAAVTEGADAAATATTEAVTEAVSSAVEEGIEMVSMAGRSAVEDGTTAVSRTTTEATETATQTSTETATTAAQDAGKQAADESSNVLKRAFSKLVEKFANLSKTTQAAILAGTQTAMSTNLFGDAAVAIATATHMSEKQKEALEIAMEVIGSLLCIVLGGLAGNGLASSSGKTTSFATTIAKNLGPNFLKGFALTTGIGGGALQTGAQAKLGAIELDIANSEAEVGKDEALANLFQSYEKIVSQETKASMQHYSSALKNEGEVQANTLSNAFAGEAAFAQILSQAV